MDVLDGLDIQDAITKVKYALYVAQLKAGQDALGVKLGGIDISLKVVETKDVTGKPVFKVPVLEWEIGGEVKIAREQVQTITLKLDAPKPEDAESITEDAFDIPLTAAILKIAEAARFAGQGDPKLVLGDSSVEFQFAYSRDGSMTLLIFEGHLARATTHTLTVRLAAA